MPGISTSHLIDLLARLYREGDRWFRSLHRDDWRRRQIDKVLAECRVIKFSDADDLQRTLQQFAAEKISRPHKALFVEPWDKAANSLLLLEPVFQKSADAQSPKVSLYGLPPISRTLSISGMMISEVCDGEDEVHGGVQA